MDNFSGGSGGGSLGALYPVMVSELLGAAFPWVEEGGEVCKVGAAGLAQGTGDQPSGC